MYDLTRLKALGAHKKRWDRIKPELDEEILKAIEAGVSKEEIAEASGYKRNAIYEKSLKLKGK